VRSTVGPELGGASLDVETSCPDGNFISGQYEDALRVVSFNVAEGWSRDVSEDIANEVLDPAFDADTTLTEGTKRFIDWHATPAHGAQYLGASRGSRFAYAFLRTT
jgi:hypothetical protein